MDKEEPFEGSVEDTEQRIRQFLATARTPISEKALLAHLEDEGYGEEQIRAATSNLMNRNDIRWVAYRGYMIGGRPE